MALVEDYFGRQVFGGTAESIRAAFDDFGETEVSQLEVACFINQKIFWLQVSVDNIS